MKLKYLDIKNHNTIIRYLISCIVLMHMFDTLVTWYYYTIEPVSTPTRQMSDMAWATASQAKSHAMA